MDGSRSMGDFQVTRSNFEQGFAALAAQLAHPDLAFVALDVEMTGIGFSERPFRMRKGDSLERRFRNMRGVATSFTVMQLGITPFVTGADGGLVAAPFSFFAFPAEQGRDFMCSPGAMGFLREHGMDFGTWASKGVPFVDAATEERLARRLLPRPEGDEDAAAAAPGATPVPALSPRTRQDYVVLQQQADIELMAGAFAALDTWLAGSPGEGEWFQLPAVNSFLRRYQYQELEAKYACLEHDKQRSAEGTCIAVRKLPADPAVRTALREQQQRDKQHELDAILGLRRVWQHLSVALRARDRVPLVGHNCLYDLLFCLAAFDALPATFRLFKRHVHDLFPLLVDTKHLVSATPLQELVGADVDSSLESLFQFFEGGGSSTGHGSTGEPMEVDGDATAPAADPAVQVSFVAGYDAAGGFHDAAWDSYCTGFVFVQLLHRAGVCAGRVPAPWAAAHGNKVRVARSLECVDFDTARTNPDVDLDPLCIDVHGTLVHVAVASGGDAPATAPPATATIARAVEEGLPALKLFACHDLNHPGQCVLDVGAAAADVVAVLQHELPTALSLDPRCTLTMQPFEQYRRARRQDAWDFEDGRPAAAAAAAAALVPPTVTWWGRIRQLVGLGSPAPPPPTDRDAGEERRRKRPRFE